MHTQNEVRDRAWPDSTYDVWGDYRYAIRNFLKKIWKEDNDPEENEKKIANFSKAKKEADEILEVSAKLQIDFNNTLFYNSVLA